jgi:hypothetical protein
LVGWIGQHDVFVAIGQDEIATRIFEANVTLLGDRCRPEIVLRMGGDVWCRQLPGSAEAVLKAREQLTASAGLRRSIILLLLIKLEALG